MPNYSKFDDYYDSFIGTRSVALMLLGSGPAFMVEFMVYFSMMANSCSYQFSFDDYMMLMSLLVAMNGSSFDWYLDAMVLDEGAVT